MTRLIRLPGIMNVPVDWPKVEFPPQPTIADDFNRPDSANFGATSLGNVPWESAGTSEVLIRGGRATGPGVTTNSYRVVPTGAPAREVAATLAAGSGQASTSGGGILIRYGSPGNCIYVSPRINGSTMGLSLDQFVGGSYSKIGPTGPVPQPGDRIAARTYADRIEVYLNGDKVMEHATTTHADQERSGFMFHAQGTSLEWDDFTVAPL